MFVVRRDDRLVLVDPLDALARGDLREEALARDGEESPSDAGARQAAVALELLDERTAKHRAPRHPTRETRRPCLGRHGVTLPQGVKTEAPMPTARPTWRWLAGRGRAVQLSYRRPV